MNTNQYLYRFLLRDSRWRSFRKKLIEKRNGRCEDCGVEKTRLEVHHKRYVIGKFPWDYAEGDLLVLCRSCHCKRHSELEKKREYVPFYSEDGREISMESCRCSRCSGKGYFEDWSHIYGGECFSCFGTGYNLVAYPEHFLRMKAREIWKDICESGVSCSLRDESDMYEWLRKIQAGGKVRNPFEKK